MMLCRGSSLCRFGLGDKVRLAYACSYLSTKKLPVDPLHSPSDGDRSPSDVDTPTSTLCHGEVLLAKKYADKKIDPTGWWMSEKYDGVRAVWDGDSLYTRHGNLIYAPDWFVQDLPSEPLDGELWAGHGRFDVASAVARRQDNNSKRSRTMENASWDEIRYAVFDAPCLKDDGGNAATIEFRNKWIESNLPHADKEAASFAVTSTECLGREHVDSELEKIVNEGGEGLMLRMPKSVYEQKRHSSLLKVTKFETDEGIVISYEPGKGRLEGDMGAINLEKRDGVIIRIGTGFTDAQRKSPPAIGSVLMFRHRGYNVSGQPRFAAYVGERFDVDLSSWISRNKDTVTTPIE
eukprot:m.69699 g.69699  ORF g.69699 m.69699 type:complete len:349 (-) comp24130_c0_seq1:144-1190(-)